MGRLRLASRRTTGTCTRTGYTTSFSERTATSPDKRDLQQSRMNMLVYGAPCVAQLAMLAMCIVERQWLFAFMIASGCLASLGNWWLQWSRTHARNRQSASEDANVSSAGSHLGNGSHADALSPASLSKSLDVLAFSGVSMQLRDVFTAIPSPSLEQLCGLEHDPAAFRTIAHWWCLDRPVSAVPLGLGVSGAMLVDLVADGPHAIVAGTTGSGKSVLLQSWCLSLAMHHPPNRLQFIFLDFKGGSALDSLSALPHVRGSVNDLDLAYATRALESLEKELKRRERLVAAQGVSDIRTLHDPPARLVIVVDEFHALHDQLPDYMDRLVRVASLGRSLGMHLIACTQNPLGQISASMKANMSLRLCLRVRDPLQSHEMLGKDSAAHIPASEHGAALIQRDNQTEAFRVSAVHHLEHVIPQICAAAQVHDCPALPPLFTAPLPAVLTYKELEEYQRNEPDVEHLGVSVGLWDDGCSLHPLMLTLTGNLAVIGQLGRGKTTLLGTLEQALAHDSRFQLTRLRFTDADYKKEPIHSTSLTAHTTGAPPAAPRKLLVVDDADELLEPLSQHPASHCFLENLRDPSVSVVFTLRTTRTLRVPEHCTARVVFPTGERGVDLADGIPASALACMENTELAIPGRAFLLNAGQACKIQIAR